MTTTDEGFSLRLGSFPIVFGRGSDVHLEFPDGKGVTGKLADVSVAPGGLPFSLVVTHDGEWPVARPETPTDEVNEADRGDVPERPSRELRGELGRLRMELELSRERTQELAQSRHLIAGRVEGLESALSRVRGERDEAHAEAARLAQELEQERSLRDLSDRIVQNDLTISEAQKEARDIGGKLQVGILEPELTFHHTPPPTIIVNVHLSEGASLTTTAGE